MPTISADVAALDTVHFDHPPLVEMVLGVQFGPLAGFTSAHFGWFWREYLTKDWPGVLTVPELPDQFEEFEPSSPWRPPSLQLKLRAPEEPGRVQFSNADGDRSIQIQRSRFLYNWRKREGPYPSHDQACVEFGEHLDTFRRFVAAAGLGPLTLNQWEVTYVNRIAKGSLWTKPEDWSAVLPGLLTAEPDDAALPLESLSLQRHCVISQREGRLHLLVQHARLGPSGDEALVVQLTARGPLRPDDQENAARGIALGHAACLREFLRITSAEAQKAWGRRS